jgi:hypothetical protein
VCVAVAVGGRYARGVGGRRASPAKASLAALVAALCLLVPALLASPAVGAGVSSKAFSELSSGASEETSTPTTTTPTTSRSSSSETSTNTSNSRTLILVAIGAAVLLLSAIGFVIVRDARRVAPVPEGDLLDGGGGHAAAARLRKRRAKAKAARQQRKRNR